ncbi:MAG: ABC transporter ATP-binding protein [bacterium]
MLNITKQFGNFKANDNISLSVKQGEIHALLGENGAGKSTLMSVLFGLYKPEQGEILINNSPVSINNPNDANNLGIGMVHQHFKLVHNFTILENIILGRESVTKLGILEFKEARQKVTDLISKYNFNLDINARISDITVGMQQKVEIIKMLYYNSNILIFDEPTAVLTPQEIQDFMIIIKNLASQGKSIIFITHKLNEIKEVANSCTIIRKGKFIKCVDVASVSKQELSELMVGKKIDLNIHKQKLKLGEPILSIQNLNINNSNKYTNKKILDDISFNVRAGEIVCIAGIDGNGQTPLVHAITGLTPFHSGKIFLQNTDISNFSIRQKSIAGISHIPEDRHKHGVVLDYDLQQNLILQSYFTPKFQKFNFLKFKSINDYADKLISQFDIRSSGGANSIMRGLSGGNQQKAVIAREIDRDPKIIIAVQPVRGLDIGAINYIHHELIKQRDEGKAILLISFELDEVMNLSDRILVMFEGKIVADLNPKKTNIQELGLFMSGTLSN